MKCVSFVKVTLLELSSCFVYIRITHTHTHDTIIPGTLGEQELEYNRDAMDLSRIRDKEEDEENHKHREVRMSNS